MDTALRILHIIFGVYMVGASIFILFILEPRVKSLGKDTWHRVLRVTEAPASASLGVSVLIILGTGIAMTIRMRGGDLGLILSTGWGIAMLVGFIATVGALVVGFGLSVPKGMHLMKMERSMKGRDPNPDETHEIDKIFTRLELVERINIVLILIALISMPVARFV